MPNSDSSRASLGHQRKLSDQPRSLSVRSTILLMITRLVDLISRTALAAVA